MSINGKDLHALASELFPLCRSVSSPENYKTLERVIEILKDYPLEQFRLWDRMEL